MKYIQIPTTCPCCGHLTQVKYTDNSKVLMCTNPDCAAKKLAQFTHFVSRKCMNIDGLSERTLEALISHGFVNNYCDIYHLTDHKAKLYKLDGMGKKSVDNLLESIENSRNVKLENFITALGIPNVGLSAAKTISNYFNGSFIEFNNAFWNRFDFTKLDDIGGTTTQSIDIYMSNNSEEVYSLAQEMNFIVEETKSSRVDLGGKAFCITGSLEHYSNRDALVKAIEDNGGKYVSGVSKKTNYLINNDKTSTSGKNKKAIDLGIPIISEQDFINMIGGV